MGILNKNLTFSENQAITATAISENVIEWNDLGIVPGEAAAGDRNLGAGSYVPILIQVVEDFATLTSLTITVETSAAAGLTTPTVIATTPAIPVASLLAGYRIPSPQVLPDATLLKYLGLRFTVAGSNATAGKITAALGTEAQTA